MMRDRDLEHVRFRRVPPLPLLARLRHAAMSAQWSLSGESGRRADRPISVAIDPFRTWAIAGRRPTIVLYETIQFPRAPGVHLEQRARRAATGGYSWRRMSRALCRLIGIDEEGTLAQLKALRRRF